MLLIISPIEAWRLCWISIWSFWRSSVNCLGNPLLEQFVQRLKLTLLRCQRLLGHLAFPNLMFQKEGLFVQ